MALRVLVVDDDPKITAFLRRSLALEGYDVLVANSGTEALRMIAGAPPDLLVLDVMMPDVDGLEVCRRIRAAGENFPILMLTARDAVSDRVKGLDQGADDYLVKPFALEELLARLRALVRRSGSGSADGNGGQQVLQFADLGLDTATREAFRGSRRISLTAKEYELLHLFMTHPRQVLTRDTLMEKVWGYDYSGESNVLEVYVGYLRSKLEAGGEPRLIQTVRGVGYVLKE
ncbi:two-component system response regulator MprA [Symbiobacterium terraclitae]|uniref:Stage 0 sporulation protein A homolog n=1 Tax=Symbiobacterium terraclitae TaxID=557451 RepID=A0ABS4JWN2_9FIRM|nr:response regulator transcription factor [Symbiobacterium terraclitae]MBP2019923.1 two-component system response regulator MprA [Symbiobacterium terraclitae]